MSREDELAAVRDQVGILAERVARLLEVISIRSDRGWDVCPYEEKVALMESMMRRLHRRQTRPKAQVPATTPLALH